jgi:hypothetical protein
LLLACFALDTIDLPLERRKIHVNLSKPGSRFFRYGGKRKVLAFLLLCVLLLTACKADPANPNETNPPASSTPPITSRISEATTSPQTTAPETAAPQTEPEPFREFINDAGKEIPTGVVGVLKALFFTLGEAENRFIHFDYTPYFQSGIENESCRYYTAQSTYYAKFRREEFDPVLHLRQTITVTDYKEENGAAMVTVWHNLRFSYAHMETNSGSGANYELVLQPFEGGGWHIDTMRCTNDWFETEYRQKIDELERMAAEEYGPRGFHLYEGVNVPFAVQALLKDFLFAKGEAEHHFVSFDYTPYFAGGRNNESCRYYTAETSYISGLRRKEDNPVLRFRQAISVTESEQQNNTFRLTLVHTCTYARAEEHDFYYNRQLPAWYDVILKETNNGWRIESMHSANHEYAPLEAEYRGKIEELEKLAAEQYR